MRVRVGFARATERPFAEAHPRKPSASKLFPGRLGEKISKLPGYQRALPRVQGSRKRRLRRWSQKGGLRYLPLSMEKSPRSTIKGKGENEVKKKANKEKESKGKKRKRKVMSLGYFKEQDAMRVERVQRFSTT